MTLLRTVLLIVTVGWAWNMQAGEFSLQKSDAGVTVKLDGTLMTDYLIKTRFSAVWSEQRDQFAAL